MGLDSLGRESKIKANIKKYARQLNMRDPVDIFNEYVEELEVVRIKVVKIQNEMKALRAYWIKE